MLRHRRSSPDVTPTEPAAAGAGPGQATDGPEAAAASVVPGATGAEGPAPVDAAIPRASDAAADAPAGRLQGVRPMHVEYDEARTGQERSTYHQPRLMAQGEFFLDVHPLRRFTSRVRRKRRD